MSKRFVGFSVLGCFLSNSRKINTNFGIQAVLPAKIRKANPSSQGCDKVGCIVYLCCWYGEDLRLLTIWVKSVNFLLLISQDLLNDVPALSSTSNTTMIT